ncbi:MAG TPA: response regulator [Bacteroidales bacterium]|nr:response regulator [Bacteroidales bacterium]
MDIVSKILIVDDRPENIAVLKTLLNDFDTEIISAGSGNEALALTLEHDFALALIDVQMPDMDGYETVRLLRKVEKTRFLPVIFLSAIYSEDHYQVQGIEAGAVDFITKPFNSRLLLGKIRVFLDMYTQRKMLENEIEHRKLIETELTEAKTKAEESDRLKSAFLANMSHEIRTPLTTIVGMGSLLASKDYPPEKKKEIAGFIEKSSNGLITIINDILDLSKIEAGVIRVTMEPVDINNLLGDLYRTYCENLKRNNKKNVELKLTIPDGEMIHPVTDENRLRQILSNFLGNAVKFTNEGYIEFGYRITDEAIQFYVSDTGDGIPKDKIDLIFRRFQKLHEISRGTGLGLSIAKRLSELLGGDISVSSEPGKGSTFFFTLPYSKGMHNQSEGGNMSETKTQIYDWSSRSIIIAEDEYPVFFLLENILEPTKVRITWAKSGRDAIEIFSGTRKFDAILLDIRMPGLDGIDTFREIRKIDKNIPIVAQTAFAMNDERDELEALGFSGFISKPFIKDEIFRLIDRLFTK